MIRTSQAVTILNSGSKANALPQYAEALVNYRISNEQSLLSYTGRSAHPSGLPQRSTTSPSLKAKVLGIDLIPIQPEFLPPN